MTAAVQLAMCMLMATVAKEIWAQRAASNCTQPGLFCLDCNTLSVCVEIQGQYVTYLMDNCSSATPCSQSLKACSDKQSLCTTETNFACTQEGFFPDPYDCNVYHECGEASDGDPEEYVPIASHVCGVGFAYNPKSRACDLAEANAACGDGTYPVPSCNGSGLSAGSLVLDPNFYWLCVDGAVRILKCAEEHIFDDVLWKCTRDGSVTEEPATSPLAGFQCSGTGREPDPTSCYSYYDCTDPENPVRASCLLGKYFHQRKQKCVLGFCPY